MCYFKCLQSKNICCLFERLFKVKKNGISLFGISLFVLEMFMFLCYANEKSDKRLLKRVSLGLIQPLLDFYVNNYLYVFWQFERKCHVTVHIRVNFNFCHFNNEFKKILSEYLFPVHNIFEFSEQENSLSLRLAHL